LNNFIAKKGCLHIILPHTLMDPGTMCLSCLFWTISTGVVGLSCMTCCYYCKKYEIDEIDEIDEKMTENNVKKEVPETEN